MQNSEHPYVKLTQTPLAQRTSICGIPATVASVIMGLLALLVVSGSHLVLSTLTLMNRPAYKDSIVFTRKGSMDFSDLKKEFEKAQENFANNDIWFDSSVLTAVGGMVLLSAVITAISGTVLLIGACQVRPTYFLAWFCTMIFAIFEGRLVPLISSVIVRNPYAKFFPIMAFVDILMIIFAVICWGQLINVQRNDRYKTYVMSSRHTVNGDDAGVVVMPPNSYPRQGY